MLVNSIYTWHKKELLPVLLSCVLLFSMAGTSAGVGFAIPSSTVTKTVPQLIQFGKVSGLAKYLVRLNSHYFLFCQKISEPKT